MICIHSLFTTFKKIHRIETRTNENDILFVKGFGKTELDVEGLTKEIPSVLHSLKRNVLSLDHLFKQGSEVIMKGTSCRIKEIFPSKVQKGDEAIEEEEEEKVEDYSDVEKETEYLQQYFELTSQEPSNSKRNEGKIEIPSKVTSIDD
ncbi:hypothetical protein L1987_32396 [Smallanthus sonchifolius]|uniref:Uncharacterized protein n=3 Tax=Smallanthus sonchifolius TaxID=185202 RepID=A0ACB9HNZ5_9ASTR|nr:hypothetical protein L1987_32392 [Smallanthus sonchifolius]KAI3797141.1 hypothetical protein L1987_32394 [Smallanthus sonchifolius]KAI3797143.1 hypothetical protein L1987_32396 [Smallanthus sonchifolius]